MISRARYGIDYIERNIDCLTQTDVIEKINRTFDVNYDMRDIQLSDDILKYLKDYYVANKNEMNEYIFLDQENNDGKLFIDCDEKSKEIKYCFTDAELNALSATEYMKWNIGFRWDDKDFSYDPDWSKISNICKRNIGAIKKKAKLMSSSELKEFINDDYTKQINDIDLEQNFKI